MRRVTNRTPKSPIFGLRYLEEEELKRTDVTGCFGIVRMPDDKTAASVTFKLDGCGSDTDTSFDEATA